MPKLPQNKNQFFFCMILFTLVLVAGVLGLRCASKIQIIPQAQPAYFSIQGNFSQTDSLQDFDFNYDFSEQKGNITFEIHTSSPQLALGVTTPLNVTINESFKQGEEFLDYNESRNESETRIEWDFDNFSKPLNETRTKVVINLSGNFVPNGIYDVHTAADAGTWEIRLLLGKYRCLGACITYINYGRPIISSADDSQLVYIIAKQEDEIKKGTHFVLTTYDSSREFSKNAWTAFSIGLIVAGIVGFVNLLCRLLKERDCSKKEKRF